uniref:Uncharacterized protein n=1 Tax=Mimiviridae sp. ChoanoV1 TaxID=2596887 RepID=A0A5B8HV79_9VIRU|nr:hypothetical protein 1_304 [Mimiviridae sp. ChoanoV1]
MSEHNNPNESTTVNNLDVRGNLSLMTQTVSAPAAAEAVAGSTISTTATVVVVSQTTNSDDRIYLPDPATVAVGKLYILSTDGVELSSAGKSVKINGTEVTNSSGGFTKELALAAGTHVVIKKDNSEWTATPGTPDT